MPGFLLWLDPEHFSFSIFSSLLTIGDSLAKNLNLLAQKEKNTETRLE
jgi:hypothetical protein